MSRSYPLDEELDPTSDFPLLFRMLLLLLVFIGIGIVSDVGIDVNWLCFMLLWEQRCKLKKQLPRQLCFPLTVVYWCSQLLVSDTTRFGKVLFLEDCLSGATVINYHSDCPLNRHQP